jgi:hypothetical protein
MERNVFEKHYAECLDKNHEVFQKYFDYKYKVLFELKTTVFEISHCLLLGFHKAAITLTNHLLERLLKLALINNEVGIGAIPIENWNEVFSEPNKKYSNINFGTSIELCKKVNLITQKEKDVLFDIFREQIRNGFSHADGDKILHGMPEKMTGFYGTFENPTKIKQVDLNQKIIPSIQSALIDNFAKNNALDYFDFVFRLLMTIEKRLIEK